MMVRNKILLNLIFFTSFSTCLCKNNPPNNVELYYGLAANYSKTNIAENEFLALYTDNVELDHDCIQRCCMLCYEHDDCNAVRCKENSRCEIGIYQKNEQEDFCTSTRERCNLKVWVLQEQQKREIKTTTSTTTTSMTKTTSTGKTSETRTMGQITTSTTKETSRTSPARKSSTTAELSPTTKTSTTTITTTRQRSSKISELVPSTTLTTTTTTLNIKCRPLSQTLGRCGPEWGGRCNKYLVDYSVYCNVESGWCGTSDDHKNAQDGDEYDWQPKTCKVDCEWGLFGDWSSCSKTCGGGEKSRTRQEATSASNGGLACEGYATEIDDCNTEGCPVNCQWGNYDSWSSCSKTCGEGEKSRTRHVATHPSNGGLPCEGDATEIDNCNDVVCTEVPEDTPVTTEPATFTKYPGVKCTETQGGKKTIGTIIALCLREPTCLAYEDRGIKGLFCKGEVKFGDGSDDDSEGIKGLEEHETTAVFIKNTCSDKIKNQDEEDIDCGGAACPPCALKTVVPVCPESCKTCKTGEAGDGGKAVNSEGICEYFCSTSGYCGDGQSYTSGEDCSLCKPGFTLFSDEGKCQSKEGKKFAGCKAFDVESNNDCGVACNILGSCIAFNYHKDRQICLLITPSEPDDGCPNGFQWVHENRVFGKSVDDLKVLRDGKAVCYAKIQG